MFLSAALLVILGATWHWTKDVSPAVTSIVTQVATNPVSWFVVVILGLSLVVATRRITVNSRVSQVPAITPEPELDKELRLDILNLLDYSVMQATAFMLERLIEDSPNLWELNYQAGSMTIPYILLQKLT